VGLAPEDGLPVGFQVMAPPLADDRLYRVGAALERLLPNTMDALGALPGSLAAKEARR